MEALNVDRIGEQMAMDDLDGGLGFKMAVPTPKHLTHAAGPETLQENVLPENQPVRQAAPRPSRLERRQPLFADQVLDKRTRFWKAREEFGRQSRQAPHCEQAVFAQRSHQIWDGLDPHGGLLLPGRAPG